MDLAIHPEQIDGKKLRNPFTAQAVNAEETSPVQEPG